jgi:RNA-binding protein
MVPSSTLSSSARRALRAAAHHLDPVVMMGQNGLTPAVLHEIDLALTAHALIKVRVQSDERETREAFLAEICQKLGCESVQHLGKLFVLWRNADGAADDNKDAEHDAAAVTAAHSPRGDVAGRGPRSKLATERASGATARAGAAAGGSRSGAAAGSRSGAAAGSRSGAAAGSRSGAQAGERRRWGEAPPEPPRREGWAPKDRRGAARFGAPEGSDDSRRRDGNDSYAAPRGRAPATGGYGAPRGTGAAPAGRSNYGGDRGGYGGGGQGGDQGYGERRSYGGGQGDGAARGRWGDRREPTQGSGGYSGGGGGFGDDRSASRQRSSYGRDSDAAGGRPPRTGGGYAGGGAAGSGGRGGWGSRDGATGKPGGFSRAPSGGRGGAGTGAGGAAGAKPRARRRMG